ncbi:unnamed protein product [Heligmosomoides polygyrus]|uniref:Glutaredoxin domain-containing protein n=1 Tax=Heligmosomoides polygyrus TaxID=6339 RepID=A0A183FJR2_HELPZ|nr:unnamed protein product [Heligmosomoides polygyrus]
MRNLQTRSFIQVSSVPVMIYTKNGCSFCTKAKSLFEKEGIEYRESNVDRVKSDAPEQYKPRVNGLVYMTRHTTMPQVSCDCRYL